MAAPVKGHPESRRLLFLAPFAPRLDATHGGARVCAQLIAELAARHAVAVLALRGFDEPPVDEVLRARCELVEEVIRPWTRRGPLAQGIRNARLVAGLARRKPMWATDFESQLYTQRLRQIARDWRPDIVHLENHIMGQYLDGLADCTAARILTEYEAGALAAPYLKRRYPVINTVLDAVDRAAWNRFEARVLRGVDAVVVFTPADREAVSRTVQGVPITRIPFGTAIRDEHPDPTGRDPYQLLFVGNYLHPPNISAALRLARDILPAVRKNVPDVRLDIVGAEPPSELMRLNSERVTVTGRVVDVRPYLDRAAVFVAPLTSGGGMRVKMLEALAAGKAIVATPLAAEGLEVCNGDQLYLAETNADFAARIAELLVHPDLRASMASRARAWACTHLGWTRSIHEYERLYDSLRTGAAA